MRRPLFIISLVALPIFSFIVLLIGINRYIAPVDIYRFHNETYLKIVDSVLSPNNSHFQAKNYRVDRIQYVEHKVAVVNARNNQTNSNEVFVFELRGKILYLTNYGSGEFTEGDFNSESIGRYIINAASS